MMVVAMSSLVELAYKHTPICFGGDCLCAMNCPWQMQIFCSFQKTLKTRRIKLLLLETSTMMVSRIYSLVRPTTIAMVEMLVKCTYFLEDGYRILESSLWVQPTYNFLVTNLDNELDMYTMLAISMATIKQTCWLALQDTVKTSTTKASCTV